MTVSQLTGKHNQLFKIIRLVSSGSRRAPKDLVLAEGIRVLEEAQRSGCSFEAVVFSGQFGSHPREGRLLDQWSAESVRLYKTQQTLLESVSSVPSPQGVIALVRVPRPFLDKIALPANALILCAHGIRDPGNLGTLVRTAAAASACLVCTIKGTVSARNPKAIRSSAGLFFRLPVVERLEPSDFLNFCERHSINLYRADPRGDVPYTRADLRTSSAIVLGNEAGGIADGEFAGLKALRIPMTDGVESLNVSIAGGLILFEALNQRRDL
jgi:TrmH family RNA methyltransferase